MTMQNMVMSKIYGYLLTRDTFDVSPGHENIDNV